MMAGTNIALMQPINIWSDIFVLSCFSKWLAVKAIIFAITTAGALTIADTVVSFKGYAISEAYI